MDGNVPMSLKGTPPVPLFVAMEEYSLQKYVMTDLKTIYSFKCKTACLIVQALTLNGVVEEEMPPLEQFVRLFVAMDSK